MNRLFRIADELAEIARARYDYRRAILTLDNDIAGREVELIPAGGWPGSNADARKAAEKAAKATDPELAYYLELRDEQQIKLDLLELDRDMLLAERQAWEWTIRDRETIAHEGGLKSSVFEDYAVFQDEKFQAEQPAVEDTEAGLQNVEL